MAVLTREARLEESRHQFLGESSADHPGSQAEDVHVVVLDHLVRGVGVVGNRGPDAGQLVGGDRGPGAGTADDDPAIGATVEDRLGHRRGVVGVVHGFGGMGAEVIDRVTRLGEPRREVILHGITGVIRPECDSHIGGQRSQRPAAYMGWRPHLTTFG
jgi:hypothetical protein